MEVKKVEKQRNYSLDLLRVIAILMIIIFHVCYKALIFNNLSGFNKLIVAFFLHFGEIGVNLFMLITGFFLYKNNSSKTTKIIRLIYDIWFYFILNIILCAIVKVATASHLAHSFRLVSDIFGTSHAISVF